MALASSTFLASPTENRWTPETNFSMLSVRPFSWSATVRYWTMGPAMSWGKRVTYAPKATGSRWTGAA